MLKASTSTMVPDRGPSPDLGNNRNGMHRKRCRRGHAHTRRAADGNGGAGTRRPGLRTFNGAAGRNQPRRDRRRDARTGRNPRRRTANKSVANESVANRTSTNIAATAPADGDNKPAGGDEGPL